MSKKLEVAIILYKYTGVGIWTILYTIITCTMYMYDYCILND
jgi:hypothetical protein